MDIFYCLDWFLWLFCFRLLQFHQTLLELEVSFVISLNFFTLRHSWERHIVHYMHFFVCGEDATGLQDVCFPWSPTDIVSSAKFVMIVEKDATFQRLLDDDFCTKLSPCIMITVRLLCVPMLSWWDFVNLTFNHRPLYTLRFFVIRSQSDSAWPHESPAVNVSKSCLQQQKIKRM